MWEINGWQLEWDRERSTRHTVNLSGKLLLQSYTATIVESVQRHRECGYKHWAWFPITLLRNFDRAMSSTAKETIFDKSL